MKRRFTLSHWAVDPWYMWVMVMLIVISSAALFFGEESNTIITQFERPLVIQLAAVNLVGASLIMLGLHLRDWNTGINLELAGAVSLFSTLIWYWTVMVYSTLLNGTAWGLGVVQVFVIVGMTHRCAQILTLKWARWRKDADLERKVTHALTGGEDGPYRR